MAAWMLPAAIIGSALVGGNAASKAASAQADAAAKAGDLSKLISDDQIALAREQFNAQALNQEPFRQGGLAAQNQLMKLLGLKMPAGQTANLLGTTSPASSFAASNLTTSVAQTADEKIKANWDEAAYLKANPDVAAELSTGKSSSGQNTLITSGYDHFIKYGQAAGRKPTLIAAPALTIAPPAATTPSALAAFKIAQPLPVTTITKGKQINTGASPSGLTYALNQGSSQAEYDQSIVDFITEAQDTYTDSMFRSVMDQYGVSPADLARATQSDPSVIAQRYAAATPKTASEIAFNKRAMADLASRQAADVTNYEPDVTTITQGVNTTPSLADVQKYFADNPGLSDGQIKTLLARENIPVALLAQATGATVEAWTPRLAAANTSTTVSGTGPSVLDIQNYARKNPNLTWTQIQQFMNVNKITPELLSQALSVPVADINAKIAQANTATNIAQPNYSVGLNWSLSNGISQDQYDKQIKDFVNANQGKMSDSMFKSEMTALGISNEDVSRALGIDLATIKTRFDAIKPTTPEEIAFEKTAQADLLRRQNEQLANQNSAIAQENATGFGALTKPFQMRMGSVKPGEAGPVFDPGTLMDNFTLADFEADPGYAFRFSEGQKALDKSMAARGLGISGANIKGAVKYGQDMGSQEYGNAFNRFQANRANQSSEYNTAFNRDQIQRNALLNPLQSMMGSGQTATNQVNNASSQYTTNANNASMNYGTNATNALVGGANARASGYTGMANALGSAVNQSINYNNMTNNNALYGRMYNNGGATTMNPALNNTYFQPSQDRGVGEF